MPGPVANPRILLCADQGAAEDVYKLLELASHSIRRHDLGEADPDALSAFDLVVIDGHQRREEALRFCRRLRGRLGDGFVPLLFILGDASPGARLACLEAGADAYLVRPFAPGELIAQVQAFLRIHQLHVRLTDKTTEARLVNHQLQQAYQQINHELEAARRIQMSFLPQSLPDLPTVRLAVQYRPCGRVGGDFYDAFRLDENHIGLYVADAMGHGVPASLLTIFLKRGVKPKDITGKQYRLVPPDEVLQRLNHDLLEQGLSENPFITMVYVLFNHRDGTLQFSRAGHPHPVYVPAEGAIETWEQTGSLLGVFATDFAVQTRKLRPGDKLLLHTDGLDSLDVGQVPSSRLLDCAALHRALPIKEYVDRLSQELLGDLTQGDDFTLLGLEMLSAASTP